MTTSRGSFGALSLIAAGSIGLCVSSANAQTCADHGVPVNGYPSWRERAFFTLTNACRISPQAYRATYIPPILNPTPPPPVLSAAAYPSVPPLQWALGLNQAARFKSVSMATVPGCVFQHASCDGSSWSARITSYYPNWSTLGENIAAGYSDPLSTTNQLILDDFGNGPSPDGSNDGHRANIMYSGYTVVGCGYGTGSNPYHWYWTHDFARPSGATTICSPVPSASHIIQSGQVVFLADYYDAAAAPVAPQSAQIVINGITTSMTLQLGTAARGTYRFATTAGSTCRSYHFEFRNATGTLYRYPAHGELRTTSEGNCTEEFVDSTTPPPCTADINGSGTLNVADIFAFLSLWFANDSRADYNHTGGVNVQDIFAYLSAWFAGC